MLEYNRIGSKTTLTLIAVVPGGDTRVEVLLIHPHHLAKKTPIFFFQIASSP